jgi:hypothetical protein
VLLALQDRKCSESTSNCAGLSAKDTFANGQNHGDPSKILLKHDRMYEHSLLRNNYTTYDVRRSQDVINTSTTNCNIMVLANPDDGADGSFKHTYKYARVLGIYHVDIVYVGPEMLDYQPIHMEFLWVRWYGDVEEGFSWNALKLDCVQFPPLISEHAFGFIDPSDVLRSCHIIPRFAQGRLHIDGKGISLCARDSSDWKVYYIDRYESHTVY